MKQTQEVLMKLALARSREQGMAAVEMALVIPILMLITVGILQFGYAFLQYEVAGRTASKVSVAAQQLDLTDNTNVQNLISIADASGGSLVNFNGTSANSSYVCAKSYADQTQLNALLKNNQSICTPNEWDVQNPNTTAPSTPYFLGVQVHTNVSSPIIGNTSLLPGAFNQYSMAYIIPAVHTAIPGDVVDSSTPARQWCNYVSPDGPSESANALLDPPPVGTLRAISNFYNTTQKVCPNGQPVCNFGCVSQVIPPNCPVTEAKCPSGSYPMSPGTPGVPGNISNATFPYPPFNVYEYCMKPVMNVYYNNTGADMQVNVSVRSNDGTDDNTAQFQIISVSQKPQPILEFDGINTSNSTLIALTTGNNRVSNTYYEIRGTIPVNSWYMVNWGANPWDKIWENVGSGGPSVINWSELRAGACF